MKSFRFICITTLCLLAWHFAPPIPLAQGQGDLQDILSRNPGKAKKMLLANPFAFDGETRQNALAVAGALKKKRDYRGAAEMHQLWASLYRANIESYKNFDLWAEYLDECLRIHDAHPESLDFWINYYKKVQKFAPDNNKVEEIGVSFLKNRMKERTKNKKPIHLNMALLAGILNHEDSTLNTLGERVQEFRSLVRRRQSREQVKECNDAINEFKKDGFSVGASYRTSCAELARYYEFCDKGAASRSREDACKLYGAALTALSRAKGKDTEGARCREQSSCLRSELQHRMRSLAPSGSDVDLTGDSSKRIDLGQIDKIRDKIIGFNHHCTGLKPIDDSFPRLVKDYYAAAEALGVESNDPSLFRDFFEEYRDKTEYKPWVRMAGHHLGLHYYRKARAILKKGARGNPSLALRELGYETSSFEELKKYVDFGKKKPVDVVGQHGALTAFWDRISVGSTGAFEAAARLDGSVRRAWGVDKALARIKKQERAFKKAAAELARNKPGKMRKWFQDASNSHDRKRAGDELARAYHKKVETLLFTKSGKGQKRTKDSDWAALKSAMSEYRKYKKYTGNARETHAEIQYDDFPRIFSLLDRGKTFEAERVFNQMHRNVRASWSLERGRRSDDPGRDSKTAPVSPALEGKESPTIETNQEASLASRTASVPGAEREKIGSEESSRSDSVGDRVAAFREMVNFTIHRNNNKTPGMDYLKNQFPWFDNWNPENPDEVVSSIHNEIYRKIGKLHKKHLRYDLCLAYAELKRERSENSEWFKYLNYAYGGASLYPDDAEAKKAGIRKELTKLKEMEARGRFEVSKKDRKRLWRNGLVEWWDNLSMEAARQ